MRRRTDRRLPPGFGLVEIDGVELELPLPKIYELVHLLMQPLPLAQPPSRTAWRAIRRNRRARRRELRRIARANRGLHRIIAREHADPLLAELADHWVTPPWLIDLARRTFGPFFNPATPTAETAVTHHHHQKDPR